MPLLPLVGFCFLSTTPFVSPSSDLIGVSWSEVDVPVELVFGGSRCCITVLVTAYLYFLFGVSEDWLVLDSSTSALRKLFLGTFSIEERNTKVGQTHYYAVVPCLCFVVAVVCRVVEGIVADLFGFLVNARGGRWRVSRAYVFGNLAQGLFRYGLSWEVVRHAP